MRCPRPSVALQLLLLLFSVSSTDGFLPNRQHRRAPRTDRQWLVVGPAARRGTVNAAASPVAALRQSPQSRIRVSLRKRYYYHGPRVPQTTTAASTIVSTQLGSSTASVADTTSSATTTTTSAADTPCERSKRKLALGMAFLTGVSDVALTLQFQTFATMLTGCLLWLSRSICELNPPHGSSSSAAVAAASWKVCYYASVFVSYLTGVAVVRRCRHWPPRRILRTVGTVVLTLFVAADVMCYAPPWWPSSRFIPVSLLAVAYGMINSIGTDFAGTLTFVVTGHLTRLTHLLTDRVFDGKRLTPQDVQTAQLSLSVCGGFTAGAVSAFYLHTRGQLLRPGLFSLLGISYAALFASYDGRRIRHWWKRRLVPDMSIRPPLVFMEQSRSNNASRPKLREILGWALQDAQHHPVVVRRTSNSGEATTTTATLIANAVDEAMADDRDVVLVQTYLPNQKNDGVNEAADSTVVHNDEDMVVVVVQNNSTIPPPINDTLDASSV